MKLIIGGAYQGKLEYARNKYNITDSDIYYCKENSDVIFSSPCIAYAEEYVMYCIKNGIDATAEFKKHFDEWKDSVIICEDIFCGVVPMGADVRAWREMTGRLCAYLSSQACEVTRMFCSLPQKLK